MKPVVIGGDAPSLIGGFPGLAERASFTDRPIKERVLRNELAIIIGCVDGRSGAEKADAVLWWIERNAQSVFGKVDAIGVAISGQQGKDGGKV